MNRKTSIIISITGITIIALILISFTYGYYLTRIDGNENSKSISITIGEMSVNYTDLSQETLSAVIEPGYETVKLFTMENTGNASSIYSIYLTDVVNEFVRTDDIQYTLYRKFGDNSIEDLSETEIIATGTFPKENAYIKTNEVIENPGDFYTYALKITYINSNENQNEDQGHTFSGKVEIHAQPKSSFSSGTLAAAIFNNSVKITDDESENGYALFSVPTLTKAANEKSNDTESMLSQVNDEDGISYYYRGNVKNNYLSLNNMCWRIVRIEGNGAIKLILADATASCNSETLTKTDSGYIGAGKYVLNDFTTIETLTNTTSINYILNEWYNNNLSNIGTKLKNNATCITDITTKYDSLGNVLEDTPVETYYDNYKKLIVDKYSSLNCRTNTTKTNNQKVTMLTVNEVALAGGMNNIENSTYYINNNATTNTWWTISPSYNNGTNDYIFDVNNLGAINFNTSTIEIENSIRPVISLVSGTLINSGDGSITNPYTIK